MFARFLHRPVLAIVTSVVLVFLGLLAMRTLPVAQFPEISPPRVIVTIAYPGASADVLVKLDPDSLGKGDQRRSGNEVHHLGRDQRGGSDDPGHLRSGI